jgi:hypothetical protein
MEYQDRAKRKRDVTLDSDDEYAIETQATKRVSLARAMHESLLDRQGKTVENKAPLEPKNTDRIQETPSLVIKLKVHAETHLLSIQHREKEHLKKFYINLRGENGTKVSEGLESINTVSKERKALYERLQDFNVEVEELVESAKEVYERCIDELAQLEARVGEIKARATEANKKLEECNEAQRNGEIEIRNGNIAISYADKMIEKLDSSR